MKRPRKWVIALIVVLMIILIFADTLIGFYIDLLWFDQYGFVSVMWTILGAKLGLGILAGSLFFAITFGTLRHSFKKSAHLPVVLSDHVRRDIPILEILAENLKPLVMFLPLMLAIMTGFVVAQQWDTVLMFFNQTPFGQVDPVFGKDISFYIFSLPFWSLIKGLLWEALILITIGIGLIHFFKQHITLGPNGFITYPEARKALSQLAMLAFIMAGFEMYLKRYGLLLNPNNQVITGISYADDWGRLPILNFLVVLCGLGAVISFLNRNQPTMRKIFLIAVGIGAVYMGSNLYPAVLKKFVVDPNELIKETPYIEHTIAGTRKGFGLEAVEENELTGSATLDASAIESNRNTIDNIRLWDQQPLLDTLGQIQEIRTYYQFLSVDNDRYRINGRIQQTLLSPRELQSSSLPNRTWINEHLTFTHGYGVALSPVNLITPEGMPVLTIKDIPPRSEVDLKITRPEIYYGELSSDHVFVHTDTQEFDYPEGEKNVYKNYEGQGGVPVASFLRKALLAARLKTLKILFSNDINNDSRVMMYRNIKERVRTVAPFLKYDRDPYLVITEEGSLVWLYDAYTTSDRFPYSQMVRDPEVIGGLANYMRNSVKITIDAYEGTMKFYVADSDDPIIQTYRNIFPKMFLDLAEMPKDLKSHIRYPSDLFAIQTLVYTAYHMKTPQVFYNKEDQWEIPEIDGQSMRPYYTIMKLPGKDHEEYILMLPFTPQGKQNLSAWMVARSDDVHYGGLVAYTFPKQKLVYGPGQIVARINQEAEISRQISMWDQRGSKVIQGTLLVIPIEESLIYVRPLYLKADAGKIPELKRVIVGYEDQIEMGQNLEEALGKIFSGLKTTERQPDDVVAKTEDATKTQKPHGGKVVLKREDYLKIREFFDRTVKTQEKLDQTLAGYREDLKDLGQALDAAEVVAEPVKKPVPQKENVVTP